MTRVRELVNGLSGRVSTHNSEVCEKSELGKQEASSSDRSQSGEHSLSRVAELQKLEARVKRLIDYKQDT